MKYVTILPKTMESVNKITPYRMKSVECERWVAGGWNMACECVRVHVPTNAYYF